MVEPKSTTVWEIDSAITCQSLYWTQVKWHSYMSCLFELFNKVHRLRQEGLIITVFMKGYLDVVL